MSRNLIDRGAAVCSFCDSKDADIYSKEISAERTYYIFCPFCTNETAISEEQAKSLMREHLEADLRAWGRVQFLADHLCEAYDLENRIQRLLAESEKLTAKTLDFDVIATHSIGRGSYDYEKMCREQKAKYEAIVLHTRQVVDWRKVSITIGIEEQVKKKYYTPGKRNAKIQIKKTA